MSTLIFTTWDVEISPFCMMCMGEECVYRCCQMQNKAKGTLIRTISPKSGTWGACLKDQSRQRVRVSGSLKLLLHLSFYCELHLGCFCTSGHPKFAIVIVPFFKWFLRFSRLQNEHSISNIQINSGIRSCLFSASCLSKCVCVQTQTINTCSVCVHAVKKSGVLQVSCYCEAPCLFCSK